MAVARAHRRKGIGRALLAAAENFCTTPAIANGAEHLRAASPRAVAIVKRLPPGARERDAPASHKSAGAGLTRFHYQKKRCRSSSVVVPAFNEEALLPGSLAAIRAAMSAFEEVGSMGGRSCATTIPPIAPRRSRAAGAKVVFEPVNQISRARNAGAAAASGDWLVCVECRLVSDARAVPRSRIEAMKSRCLAGGATVTFETRDRVIRAWIAAWNALSRSGRWAAGSFIFCEAAAFREVGGFSQELYAAEELDLFKRLKRVARRQRRQEIVILHRHPLRTSDRKARLYTNAEHILSSC